MNTGRVVIDGQYKHAWHFSEGLAAFVADNGKMVIPAIYSDISMISKDLLMAEVDGDEENNLIFTTDGKMQK